MTIAELKNILDQYPDEMKIVLQKDSEGNSYSPLLGAWQGGYKPYNNWSGEAGLLELTDDDRKQGYTQEDIIDGDPTLFLYPVN